jgi:mono/diheme cytochrome c family protein
MKNTKRLGIPATCSFLMTFALHCLGLVTLSACKPPPIPNPDDELIARGRDLFFKETFDGNGRTCGSCHPASNNFTIDPAFIATLADDDPLFVAESDPNLEKNFENPTLMREFGLILENQDGFGDLENNFNMRGVPHTLGLPNSIDSRDGPRTGWSGDGAPGDGSLRSFATGAVIQHFTKTLGRVPGVDFRLPSNEELDAMEAFQLSLGRQEELSLPLPLKGTVAARGQEIFNDATLGKCSICHVNAGANGDPNIFGPDAGNLNFNTGVEDLPDQPADLTGELVPPDDGFGTPGDGTFNTPPLIESADTGAFFHNNSVETIEGAVAFYNGDAFNNSPAGQLLAGATGGGINLDATQVVAVAAFLRVINTLENIRQSIEFLDSFAKGKFLGNEEFDQLLARALQETDDSIAVLTAGGLNPIAVAHLREARRLTKEAMESRSSSEALAREAIGEQEKARDELVES